jgi:hypothetical protein
MGSSAAAEFQRDRRGEDAPFLKCCIVFGDEGVLLVMALSPAGEFLS